MRRWSSGRDGRYKIKLLTDVGVALKLAAGGAHATTIRGAWRGSGSAPKVGPSGGAAPAAKRGGNAGGCHLEATWSNNPQYLLTVSSSSGGNSIRTRSMKIALRRPAEAWAVPMQRNAVDTMAGFYLIRAPDVLTKKLPLRSKAGLDIVHESCFSPTLEVGCTVELIPDDEAMSFVLVPSTYGPGQMGPFSIELVCDSPIQWTALA